ncbi:MAG: hypothetical protein WB507_10320 [Solirubrobacterales bacterium]
MPLVEGHWQRANKPLRQVTGRERRVVIGGLAVTFIAILALLIPGIGGSTQPGPAPGCVRALVAGRVGGEVVHACGAAARALCARTATFHGPRSETILASCRAAGISFADASPEPAGQG